jgi:hypothetical protein
MKPYLRISFCVLLSFMTIAATAKQPSFSQYTVSLFKGHPAKLIIKGNALAEMYRTIITETYYSKNRTWRNRPTRLNFAGHYCLVWWGCGSDCQHAAVVDVQTGKVYDGPTAERQFDFKRNSRLVIVNPNINDCSFCKKEFWVWNDRSKKFNKIR